MAVIDFKCVDCGHEFFEIVGFNDRDKVKCPKCGSKNIKQVFSGTSYIKGGGSSKSGGGCGGSCGTCGGCH